jgi:hypothetical protein
LKRTKDVVKGPGRRLSEAIETGNEPESGQGLHVDMETDRTIIRESLHSYQNTL